MLVSVISRTSAVAGSPCRPSDVRTARSRVGSASRVAEMFDVQRQRDPAAGPQRGHVPARPVQHVVVERADQAGPLGRGDERLRRHRAALPVGPPGQGLHGDGAGVAEPHDRLVRHVDLAPVQRLGQPGRQAGVVEQRDQGGVVVDHDAAAAALGRVHRGVGPAQQQLCRRGRAVPVRHDQPDAGPYGPDLPVERERRGQRGAYPVGHHGRLQVALHEHGELVAAQPGHRVGRRRAGPQPVAHLPEQRVAGGVPERVVDHLELVQVDEQQAERAALVPVHVGGVREPVAEQGPVGQAGERVVEGLVGQLLLAALDLLEQPGVLPQRDELPGDDQADDEQPEVDLDPVEGPVQRGLHEQQDPHRGERHVRHEQVPARGLGPPGGAGRTRPDRRQRRQRDQVRPGHEPDVADRRQVGRSGADQVGEDAVRDRDRDQAEDEQQQLRPALDPAQGQHQQREHDQHQVGDRVRDGDRERQRGRRTGPDDRREHRRPGQDAHRADDHQGVEQEHGPRPAGPQPSVRGAPAAGHGQHEQRRQREHRQHQVADVGQRRRGDRVLADHLGPRPQGLAAAPPREAGGQQQPPAPLGTRGPQPGDAAGERRGDPADQLAEVVDRGRGPVGQHPGAGDGDHYGDERDDRRGCRPEAAHRPPLASARRKNTTRAGHCRQRSRCAG